MFDSILPSSFFFNISSILSDFSANILLDFDFNVKLCDFGIVCFGPLSHSGETSAHTAHAMGTKIYMAPEAYTSMSLDGMKVNVALDIYSFGVVS